MQLVSNGERDVTDDELVPIDRIAKVSGVASSALRYYERCGLISAGIKISGRRHYDAEVLHRLSVIKVCQAMGFSLTEIADMLDTNARPDGAWRDLALRRLIEIEEQIRVLRSVAEILDSAMCCKCADLTGCPEMGPHGVLATRTAEGRRELTESRFGRPRSGADLSLTPTSARSYDSDRRESRGA
jgi:MerR family redox-sensitive transcriptional activator SoxR